MRSTAGGNGRASFTLVELMVVMGLALALGIVVLGASRAMLDSLATVNAQGVLQMRLSQAADAFVGDVHLATAFPSSCCGSFTRDLDSTDDGEATLILQVPSLDTAGQLTQTSFDHIVYDFARGTSATGPLVRDVRPHANSIRRSAIVTLSQDVADVVFLYSARDAQVTLSGSRIERGRTYSLTLVAQSAARQ